MAEVTCLGAGCDVGRSCVVVKIGRCTLMFDCGVHMGYDDQRRWPDFSTLGDTQVDCLFITHFHLDHCGALPYYSEQFGYTGPIVMSAPTRAIAPLMLEDFRKVMVEHRGETEFFTVEQIKNCMNRVTTIDLHQTLLINDIKVTAYYAGHVLGAVMFHVEVGGRTVLYTGDYNMVGDRHLRAAWVPKLKPQIVITESTYATKYRELKMKREKAFLKKVRATIERGGKVLVPVFALGRAQELCLLLDTYWERANIDVPIHFAGGLSERANHFYKTYIDWCNENVQRVFLQRNLFDFQHVTVFDRSMIKSKDSMVLFATPGMLHGGLSLAVFKEWCDDARNTVIIPGYCVPGTVGHRLMKNRSERMEIEGRDYSVRCEVAAMSFSAHTDHRGIMQLLQWVQPEHVILVHGEVDRIKGLQAQVTENLKFPCYMPENFQQLIVPCAEWISRPIKTDDLLEKRRAHIARHAQLLWEV